MNYDNRQYHPAPNYVVNGSVQPIAPQVSTSGMYINQQQPMVYPSQQQMVYNQQQPMVYPSQQQMVYPSQQQPMVYPTQQQPMVYPNQQQMYYPNQQQMTYQALQGKPTVKPKLHHQIILGIFGLCTTFFMCLSIISFIFGVIHSFSFVFDSVIEMIESVAPIISESLKNYASSSVAIFVELTGVEEIIVPCGDADSISYEILGEFRLTSIMSGTVYSLGFLAISYGFYIVRHMVDVLLQ